MTSEQILNEYLNFYKDKGHYQIPNVSLVPENDPTLLFVNSGVFPLVPYVFGEKHALGKRLMNVQRCVRFDDLENVGVSNRHTVAFHMIGNWSLGDYFKEKQLPWIWEFFIENLKLDPKRMYGTVFMGNKNAPKDTESIEILKEIYKKYGIEAKENERIFAYEKDNWWQRGETEGEPGGPSSEIYYYIGDDGVGLGKNPQEFENEFIEIGNSVFMQFKLEKTGWKELPQKNVDFGGGLERIALAVQNKQDIFQTDNFWPIILQIQKITEKDYQENEKTKVAMRVLADHIRTAVFMAMDDVVPSNKDQGYILRRILRRMVRVGRTLDINADVSVNLVGTVVNSLSWLYPKLKIQQKYIENLFAIEEEKFRKVLLKGSKQAEKEINNYLSKNAQNFGPSEIEAVAEIIYKLYQSEGYPVEIFLEDIKDNGQMISRFINQNDLKTLSESLNRLQTRHQELSRKGSSQKFAGGLADHTEQNIKYHTSTHLLHWALREILGKHIQQQGSNITGERLRFDFSHNEKLSKEELEKIENLINQKISENIPVDFKTMSREDAEKSGALHFFNEKYGDKVKVYFIGENIENAFSKEFCGGPHVSKTGELDPVCIYKQEKLGEGKMRLYVKRKDS